MTPLALQSRIVIALTLAGCSVQPLAQPELPASSELPERVVEPGEPDQPQLPPTPEPRSLSAVVFGADLLGDVTVELIGEPGTQVLLFASDAVGSDVAAGLEVDLVDPIAVASVELVADEHQVGVAKISAPHLLGLAQGETIYVQAVSLDGTWKTPVSAEPLRRFERTCAEIAPAAPFKERIVCDAEAIPGQCPAPDGLIDPLLLVARTFGDAPVSATAICQETAATGSCCYQMEVEYGQEAPQPIDTGWIWDAGRPFRVDGESRQADLERQTLDEARDEAIAEGWAAMAREEHASVAAFARFSMELMHLGAPMELVRDACKAQLDEAHHAQLTLALASEFAAQPLKLGAIAMDGALEGRDLRTVTLDVVREGCINETVSTVIAMAARDGASHDGAREALTIIAEDEAHHSELAWRFVAWALEQDPSLREEVLAELNGFRPEVTSPRSRFSATLAAHGVLDARATQEAAFRAGQVIRRCASSLS